MRILRTIILLLLLPMWVGCAQNPIKDWHRLYVSDSFQPEDEHPDKELHEKFGAIDADLQAYFKQNKHDHSFWIIETIEIYEDGTGKHAVKLIIETGSREYTEFYLMYDKANVRYKIIKGSHWTQFHI